MKIDAYKILDAIPLDVIQQYLNEKVNTMEEAEESKVKLNASQKKQINKDKILRAFHRTTNRPPNKP